MGPMRAARSFALALEHNGEIFHTARVVCDLYGSLALTGHGHGTDRAVLLGLCGEEAATIDPDSINDRLALLRQERRLPVLGKQSIAFDESTDLLFHKDKLFPPGAHTEHPNGLRFTAYNASGVALRQETFFSTGGGFITRDGAQTLAVEPSSTAPYSFTSAAELLQMAEQAKLSIWQLMLANESATRSESDVFSGIEAIWAVMQSSIEHGLQTEGTLPGGLNVRRRASKLAQRLRTKPTADPLAPLDWVTAFAMAVNEENAAGGRIVTAPTNGAAGVIPAVFRYYLTFIPGADQQGILRSFLTSAAIGGLYKENASISGAEVGCQGEVGVACSMAAGGLVAALGGNNREVEHAAEIAMEHNLGMTCDPIGGLVQIPCIERNGIAAVKAVQAARLAMNESEGHKVSLDQVIRTMYLTGLDMQSRYKETSLAGLALNIIEC